VESKRTFFRLPLCYSMADSTLHIQPRKNIPPRGRAADPVELIGRYTLHAKIGAGGMASVHLGWISGAADFSRVVAIKRMHPRFLIEDQSATRFRDEARLSSRLLHPSIVQVLDVVEHSQELLIVMEYVHGVSIAALMQDAQLAGCRIPPSVVAGILIPALHGLHGAHEATDDDGYSIGVVHRDFSPQNIMVSTQGHAKVLDFGIAKARTHLHVTSSGSVSGKFGYLSPEQAQADTLDRRTDVFSAGIVLWEMLTGARLFGAQDITEAAAIHRVLNLPVPPPSTVNPDVSSKLDHVVLQALERSPGRRIPSAHAFALELESAIDAANPSMVAAWVGHMCGKRLALLSRRLNRTRRCMRRSQPGAALAAPPAQQGTDEAPMPRPEQATAVTINERPSGRWRVRWGKVLAVGGVLVVLTVGLRLWPHLVGPAPMASTSSGVSPAPSAQTTPHIPLGLPPLNEVSTAAAASLKAGAGGVQPASPDGRARARAEKSRHLSKPSRAQLPAVRSEASPRPNCDPPTYLDTDGIRIFKDECL
jgi:hypothetical protein